MNALAFLYLFLGGGAALLGDIFSKKWIQTENNLWLIYGFIAYSTASASWFALFREGKILAQIGPIWTIFQLVLCVGIGVLLFGERLTFLHRIGIILAILSVALLSTKGNS